MVYAHIYSIIVIDENECPTKIKVRFKTINNVQNNDDSRAADV